jgi:hypothetical protein
VIRFIVALVLVVAVLTLGYAAAAGITMLLIGNASIASGGVIPALGFEPVFWLTVAAGLLLSPASLNRK